MSQPSLSIVQRLPEAVELNTLRLTGAFGARPFTVGDAAEVGISRSQLRTCLAHGKLDNAGKGLFLVRDLAEEETDRNLPKCEAALRRVTGSVISHESAALMHGLAFGRRLPRKASDHVFLTVDGSHKKSASAYTVSGSTLRDSDVTTEFGLPVTSIARTVVDVARVQKLPDAVMVMDSGLRRLIADSLISNDLWMDVREAVHDPALVNAARAIVEEVLSGMKGRKGVPFAMAALRCAHPGSESAFESGSRYNAYALGIPTALIGWPVQGASGRWYYADFLWPDQMLIGEADGAMKYATGDPARLIAEKEREDDLRAAGFDFARWPWHEGIVAPHLMSAKIDRKLRERSKTPGNWR